MALVEARLVRQRVIDLRSELFPPSLLADANRLLHILSRQGLVSDALQGEQPLAIEAIHRLCTDPKPKTHDAFRRTMTKRTLLAVVLRFQFFLEYLESQGKKNFRPAR